MIRGPQAPKEVLDIGGCEMMPKRELEGVKRILSAEHQAEHQEGRRATLQDRSNCDRCGGFLVRNWVVSLKNDGGDVDVLTHRCVQCGETHDPVVLRNRRSAITRFRGKTMIKPRKLTLASRR